jgi:ribosome-binding protein aMBF1 (putative translation factor)
MKEKKTVVNAVEIIQNRYIGNNSAKQVELEEERVNAQVARLIHDLRIKAGLNQQQMAKMIGTTQSVISRLEDADYSGHSLSMLNRIAKAFKQKIIITMSPQERKEKTRGRRAG